MQKDKKSLPNNQEKTFTNQTLDVIIKDSDIIKRRHFIFATHAIATYCIMFNKK